MRESINFFKGGGSDGNGSGVGCLLFEILLCKFINLNFLGSTDPSLDAYYQ